jgi:hypothetical protein
MESAKKLPVPTSSLNPNRTSKKQTIEIRRTNRYRITIKWAKEYRRAYKRESLRSKMRTILTRGTTKCLTIWTIKSSKSRKKISLNNKTNKIRKSDRKGMDCREKTYKKKTI